MYTPKNRQDVLNYVRNQRLNGEKIFGYIYNEYFQTLAYRYYSPWSPNQHSGNCRCVFGHMLSTTEALYLDSVEYTMEKYEHQVSDTGPDIDDDSLEILEWYENDGINKLNDRLDDIYTALGGGIYASVLQTVHDACAYAVSPEANRDYDDVANTYMSFLELWVKGEDEWIETLYKDLSESRVIGLQYATIVHAVTYGEDYE